MLLLLQGVKGVVRQGFYNTELPRVDRFCRENGIHGVRSTFKVLLSEGELYSNKGFRVPLEDPRQGMYFIYFSNDEQKAYLASYYELMSNHRELGLLLGYPPCCVDFFCRNFSERNTNLGLLSTNPLTNLSKRDQDCVLLSHFPCSSECPESMRLARTYLDVIQKADRGRAEEMIKILQC